MLTLGIESSCDETSVALLTDSEIIANEIYTQKLHSDFGGVVPELASRAHLEKVDVLTEAVLKKTGITISDVDLIAVTDHPGLSGALLIGISFALGLHTAYKIPIIGVNHLQGHICSALLENEVNFPFLSLVVSGGHTAIYRVDSFDQYTCIGSTIDDAAGEAFDKIGKMIGFDYPAGAAIEKEAKIYTGQQIIDFPVAKIKNTKGINFSFSGLKTAVKYHIQNQGEGFISENRPLICNSFQKAVIKTILRNLKRAVIETGIKKISMVGGVACNSTLRSALKDTFKKDVFFPSPRLCTDNAAMIAKAGMENYKLKNYRYPSMKPSKRVKI